MKTKARVTDITDGVAIVEVIRSSACEGCHKNADGKGCSVCSLLGGERSFTARAENPLGASVGDTVAVETDTRRVMWYAVTVFLIPLLLAALGWGIGVLCSLPPAGCFLTAGIGFLLSFVCLFFYSKAVGKRRCDVVITEIYKE